MDVKLKDIAETIVDKQNIYYRVIPEKHKSGDVIRQAIIKRNFPVHSTKHKMEELLEKYKPKDYLSRLNCSFVFETIDEANKFNELAHQGTYEIYKVRIFPKGNIIKVDSAQIGHIHEMIEKRMSDVVDKIKDYWAGKPNKMGDKPIWEILFNGDIQIIERVDDV